MSSINELEDGLPEPLGARWDGRGVNFALFSANAERVELCLFDTSGRREQRRLQLPGRTGNVWHGYMAEAAPGLIYGYRVAGPYQPATGHRFNPHKLLVDPYARAIKGRVICHPSNFGYRHGDPAADVSFDDRDNARYVPKGIVVGPRAPPSLRPQLALADTIIYEVHVKGMTHMHPRVPQAVRGKIAGLASPAVIEHLVRLGVTAVELMPIFPFADEPALTARGLTNYWGYNPYCFCAIDPRYLTARRREEFQSFISLYHQAGLEVLLDVVFNHTAEGDELGPTLSLRGIDNASYYWLDPADRRRYVNYSGCGNTLNFSHPQVHRLILDVMRLWASELGVDGFRLDLGSTLGRVEGRFDPAAPLLTEIERDPVLSRSKIIVEPWDVAGNHLGDFPPRWAEWNDRYRDTVRAFWRGDRGRVADLATRIAGSSDILAAPTASINFITSHDGFTLEDLVSYAAKHNEANGQGGTDGHGNEYSINHGVEGSSSDPAVRSIRRRQKMNMLATLFLSQGVPMLLAGDELGRTQGGNNNAYCQDGPLSWIDWSHEDTALTGFISQLTHFRKSHPQLSRTRFLTGRPDRTNERDIRWVRASGEEMTAEDWENPDLHCFGFILSHARSHLAVMMNSGASDIRFCFEPNLAWQRVFDTADTGTPPKLGADYLLASRSVAVFLAALR